MCGVVSTLEALIERTVGGLGYELADFEYINNGRMLRVFIEKLHEVDSALGQGGITVADCEAASRQLQHVLEVEGIAYDRLEVSSPGLDRRNFTGTVRAVTGERVEIEFEGDRMAFDMTELDRARLVPKL
jgi:ribosome maturation factor RimP